MTAVSRTLMPPKWELERLTATGFTVVSIDNHLAPGTGLPEIIEDVTGAYAWMRTASLNIDPDRIAVMGMSDGAYLALVSGYRLSPRPKALISFYGYGDLTGTWYTQPSPFYNAKPAVAESDAFKALQTEIVSEAAGESAHMRDDLYTYTRERGLCPGMVGGHDPLTEAGWFVPYEPIRNNTPDYPPTLLLHGQKNIDVPFAQALLIAEALKCNKVEQELISNPDWDHAFDYRASDKDPAAQQPSNACWRS